MDELDALVKEREYYNAKMGDVLNGSLHLKKDGEKVVITDEQKKKDLFLYKFYESSYDRVDALIESYINS